MFWLQYSWFVAGLSLIGIVSFIDDVRSLPDSVRLVAQFAAMFLMFFQFGIINWHDWWIVIIALIVCVGIVNAYNFMDGINGMTGGYSLAVLAPLIYLNREYEFVSMSYLYVTGLSQILICIFKFLKKAKSLPGEVA